MEKFHSSKINVDLENVWTIEIGMSPANVHLISVQTHFTIILFLSVGESCSMLKFVRQIKFVNRIWTRTNEK